jgi:predicted enzyme related to lactoylglutathione lyase
MSTQGAFIWYDLMTTDMPAAESFYGSVVGWRAEDSGMPGHAYTLLKAGDRPAGGMMALPPESAQNGVPPCWTGYVAVGDVDAAAAAFAADGGTVHKAPQDIPGVGRFAVVADPQGAVLCLFRGQGEMGPPPAPGAPGFVGWHELMTSDLEAGFAFYAKHFGWTKAEAMDMGPMGVYQIFAHNGVAIGGMMTRPPHVPVSYWGFYFNVPKIKEAMGKVTAGGGEILHGPTQVPGGSWIIQARDPQGAFFALVGPE